MLKELFKNSRIQEFKKIITLVLAITALNLTGTSARADSLECKILYQDFYKVQAAVSILLSLSSSTDSRTPFNFSKSVDYFDYYKSNNQNNIPPFIASNFSAPNPLTAGLVSMSLLLDYIQTQTSCSGLTASYKLT